MRKSKMVAKKGMKVRIPTGSGLTRFILGPLGRTLLIAGAVFTILGFGVFTYFYLVYAPLIDKKLGAGPIANTAKIFAAPESVAVGDASTPEDVAADLRRSGYTESRSNPIGYYQIYPAAIEVYPRPGLLFRPGSRRHQIFRRQDLRRSSRCRTTRRATSTSWNRSSSPISPAPTARSGAS